MVHHRTQELLEHNSQAVGGQDEDERRREGYQLSRDGVI
jgi:hypothetical protein